MAEPPTPRRMSETPISSTDLPAEKAAPPLWMCLLGAGILAFVLVSMLPFVLLFGFLRSDAVAAQPFDRAKWLDPGWRTTGATHTVRQEMVDDLLARTLRPGMSMDEVRALIGTPDESPYFKPGDWTSFLGLERGYNAVDNEWLAIDFDEVGRIRAVRLATD